MILPKMVKNKSAPGLCQLGADLAVTTGLSNILLNIKNFIEPGHQTCPLCEGDRARQKLFSFIILSEERQGQAHPTNHDNYQTSSSLS